MSIVNTLTQSYRCSQNAPLGCQKPRETIEEIPGAKFCLECGFPTPLPAQSELRGRFGTYRISDLLRSQGLGRLYSATQISNGQSVVVKEFLLPDRCFNATEAAQRRAVVRQMPLNTPKSREFRVIAPVEAIADSSCDRIHLIFASNIAATPTLKQVLQDSGAFPAHKVRQVLQQVLQTLHFIHSQPAGTEQADMAHGNLSLNSLLISDDAYVYTCDLAAWEQLFTTVPPQISSPAQDLNDLGLIGFSLWSGQAVEPDALTDLREAPHWPQDDPPLNDFLHRLLVLDAPFESAAAARQVLLKLPQPDFARIAQANRAPEEKAKKKRSRKYWLLSLLALPVLGGLLWLIWPRSSSHAESNQFKRLLPSFADVNGVQPGQNPYTGEALGTWSTVLGKKPVSDRNIRTLLTQPKPDIKATFEYRGYRPERSPLTEVLEANGKAEFAIASLSTPLPDGLIQETVAYDGLLVYVPAYKSQNLPRLLKGQLSLEQLQQIFTGQITNWQQLDSGLPNLPIKPYRPTEPEALRLFEQKVLGNDSQLIAQFRNVEQRATFNTLRSIAAGEQQNTEAGSISFGLLTQTWDQCKVYPLALSQKDKAPVQPLLRQTTQGTLKSISPADNLCLEKKPLPNLSAFQSAQYPLSMPLIVAYPRDNNLSGHSSGPLFATFLKTQDGQYLLRQAGLVPLQPTPEVHQLSQSIVNH
ncbi:MAG: substrate-binding domain-containing protein [Thermosynechococcaceae cyanobacterium]